MTLASSWTDLIVGVDIHTHLVPTPGGPVPTPIPQPFVGLVGDPVAMIVGVMSSAAISLVQGGPLKLPRGLVLINGLPATTTDGGGKNRHLLPHVPTPPGTAHVKKPSGEAKLPLGLLKITFGGASAIPLGSIAMSCGDPPLPSSKVVVIPKGSPVLLLGTPGIDVGQAVAGWAMGKLIRTAWSGVSRLAQRLGKLSASRLRNLIPTSKCTTAGHPVDVATGRVFTSVVDFSLPGPLPLVFERSYFSSWAQRSGPLGAGWSHALDQALWLEGHTVVHRNGEGQEIVFDLGRDPETIERGQEVFEPFSRNTLVRTRRGWQVISPAGLLHHFAIVEGETDPRVGYARVVRTTTRVPDVAIVYQYDRAARLASVVDCAGRVVKLEHDSAGRLESIWLPHPEQPDAWLPHVRYRHSDAGLLEEVADAEGRLTRYAYDGTLMVQETDRNGVSFFWVYDGAWSGARCVRTWGQSGEQVIYNQKLDYDPHNRVTVVTDSYDRKTMYRMNHAGAVVEVLDPLGAKTRRTFDDALQPISELDPEDRETKHQYGPRGQLLLTVLPDGGQQVWKYDARFPELVKLHRNEAGAVWRYSYDDLGRLRQTLGPERDASVSCEWQGGQVQVTVRGGARSEVLERDGQHNPVVVRLPGGAVVRQAYDRRGNLTAVTDPQGAAERLRYDLLGRLVQSGGSGGARRELAYDGEGNVIEAFDGSLRVRCTYAGWNKLASREEGGDVVRYLWGAEGELREIRNERNHEHRFHYDPCLRVERETAFDLQETRYRRDRSGWVTRIEKPGADVHTEVKLDPCGRILERKNADGTFARFVYRRDGEVLEATNQTTTVTFQRDALGRVTRETQGEVAVASSYASGFRARMESSLGAGLEVVRDTMGNPTSYATLLPDQGWKRNIEVTRDPSGLETRRSLPGGVFSEWHRDPTGRPTAQTAIHDNQTDWTRRYTWDAQDRLTALSDSQFGARSFQYDLRNRLIAERQGDDVLHRTFDEVGNVYRSPDRSDRRYVRGGIIRNDRDTTFAFDPLGRLSQKTTPQGTWRYEWDGDGMLARVHRPDDSEVTFAYDALGRRVRKTTGEVETRWVWDGDVILHELHPDRPAVTWHHEPESFTPLLQHDATGNTRHVLTDHLGTPTAMYDTAGKLAWRMQLDAFGVPLATQAAAEPYAIRWPGQYEDRETGLYYNRFRYYDPALGSYVSQDPIGLLGGLHSYAYAGDPLRSIDPFGLVSVDPWTINFSQRTVGREVLNYARDMMEGRWNWSRSGPLKVMVVDGQLVTYNNRRLIAAQNAGLASVPIEIVDSRAIRPSTDKPWHYWFVKRSRKAANRVDGEPAPLSGFRAQPAITCK